jgi:hypothetical protein
MKMRALSIGLMMAMLLLASSAFADTESEFLEACEMSPYVDEMADCQCVYNEAEVTFSQDELAALVPFVAGAVEMEAQVEDAFAFLVGKCS